MCGIVAIYSYAQEAAPVNREELIAVRDAMAARGPDGRGLWLSEDGRVGFGHRRLAIIDLSPEAAQPMSSPDGSLHITFNGEIYNYRELRSELRRQGYSFRSHSDTEVLLCLYDQEGPDMVHRLRGMYAFALWDQRRNGLFLARDPFGIKPLYYSDDGGTFRTASSVKALLAGGAVSDGAEPAGHVGFFLWGCVPEPYTFYRSIRSLPAGAHMWIDGRGPRPPALFFSVRDTLIAAEEQTESTDPDAQSSTIQSAVIDSVEHHLVADVPVGIFLSAGLDSTSLVGLARLHQPSGLKALTLGFEEYRNTDSDEVPLAAEVAKLFETEHETYWVRRGEFQDDLESIIEAMDQPSTDGVNTYYVSKAGRQTGFKVALSGLGGDEIFGGYPSHRQIPKLVKALAPLRAVPPLGRAFRWISAPILRRFTSPKYAGLLEYGTSVSDAYLLRRALYMPWELPHLLDPSLVRDGWAELRTRLSLQDAVDGLSHDSLQVTALELCWYLRNQLLRDADWAGMSHSLEVRVPLVDVGLFGALVPALAGDRRPTKQALPQMVSPSLPEAVLNRPKTGFTVPLPDWLSATGLRAADRSERGLRGWARFLYAAFTGS